MKKFFFVLLAALLSAPFPLKADAITQQQLKEINAKLDAIMEHQREWDEWFVEVTLADRTLITQYRKAHRMSTEELYRRWDYPKKYQDLVSWIFRLKNKDHQELWKRLSPIRKAEFKKFLEKLQK